MTEGCNLLVTQVDDDIWFMSTVHVLKATKNFIFKMDKKWWSLKLNKLEYTEVGYSLINV